jgi:hypothetical protein
MLAHLKTTIVLQMAGSRLVTAMAALLEDKENGDYSLVCGDKVMVVHSYILAARWVGHIFLY